MCSRQRTCQKKRSTWQTVWNTNFTWKGSSQFPEISELFWHGICSALEYGQEIARILHSSVSLPEGKRFVWTSLPQICGEPIFSASCRSFSREQQDGAPDRARVQLPETSGWILLVYGRYNELVHGGYSGLLWYINQLITGGPHPEGFCWIPEWGRLGAESEVRWIRWSQFNTVLQLHRKVP